MTYVKNKPASDSRRLISVSDIIEMTKISEIEEFLVTTGIEKTFLLWKNMALVKIFAHG